MSDEEERRREIAKKTIVLEVPGMEAVVVERDVPYREGAVMDVYRAPGTEGQRRTAVVFACGFKDPRFGAAFRQMGVYTSWARLMAASGMVAVLYGYDEPRADLRALLDHLRLHREALGIDGIELWAASGNVGLALTTLMDEPPDAFRAAVLCYGYMLDGPVAATVAAAAERFGFHTATGRTVAELPAALPLMVVRAGRDEMPGINATIDDFVAGALARNLPLTVVNHPTGPHSFDLFDASESSREIIRSIVQFLRFHAGAR